MRVRLRVLVPGTRVRVRRPGQVSVACGSSVTGWLAPASSIPPTACGRNVTQPEHGPSHDPFVIVLLGHGLCWPINERSPKWMH